MTIEYGRLWISILDKGAGWWWWHPAFPNLLLRFWWMRNGKRVRQWPPLRVRLRRDASITTLRLTEWEYALLMDQCKAGHPK